MKKFISIMLVLLLAFSLVACGGGGEAETEEPETIRIAVDEAWTGANAGNGEWLMYGVNIAVDEINASGGILGKQIEVVFEDNQSTQNGSINAMNKIVEDDSILAVIGPHMSTDALAVSDTVLRSEIIYMTGGSSMALNDGNEWMFKLRCQDDIVAKCAAQFAVEELGATKIGVMYNNDEFGVGGRDIITAYLDSVGVPYVLEGHNSGDNDFTSQILKMKSEGVDCLITWTSGDVTKIVKQRYELGFEGHVITSSGFASDWMLQTMTLEECVGVYSATDMSPDDPNPAMQALVNESMTRYGVEAEAWIACYYNAVYILKEAIEAAGTTDREAVKNALYEIEGMDSVLGVINCDENGALVHECVITVVNEEKKLQLVDKVYGG